MYNYISFWLPIARVSNILPKRIGFDWRLNPTIPHNISKRRTRVIQTMIVPVVTQSLFHRQKAWSFLGFEVCLWEYNGDLEFGLTCLVYVCVFNSAAKTVGQNNNVVNKSRTRYCEARWIAAALVNVLFGKLTKCGNFSEVERDVSQWMFQKQSEMNSVLRWKHVNTYVYLIAFFSDGISTH